MDFPPKKDDVCKWNGSEGKGRRVVVVEEIPAPHQTLPNGVSQWATFDQYMVIVYLEDDAEKVEFPVRRMDLEPVE